MVTANVPKAAKWPKQGILKIYRLFLNFLTQKLVTFDAPYAIVRLINCFF